MRITFTLLTAGLLLAGGELSAQRADLVGRPVQPNVRTGAHAVHQGDVNALRGGAPVNDECANATPVPVVGLADCGTQAVAGDNSAATQSMGDPSCDQSDSGYSDVWYSFNSGDNSTVFITLTPDAAMTDWCMVLHTACDTTTDLACLIVPEGAQSVPVTPNTDYSIRVYSNLQYGVGGPHTICVAVDNSPVPDNDACGSGTAQDLAIGGSINFTGTTAGATIDGDYDPADLSTFPAVWHTFNVTDACADVTISYCGIDPAFGNWYIVVSTACPMTQESAVFATTNGTDECADGNPTVGFLGLTAGTYYVPVLSDLASAYGPYSITITATTCATAPANDDCAGAFPLTAGAECVGTVGTTLLATESLPADSCNGFLGVANDDVWYSFVATQADMTVAVQGDGSFDAVIEVYDGACGSTSEIGCADATVGGEAEEVQLNSLVVGQTYYFRLFNYGTAAPTLFTFNVCVVEGAGTNIGIEENTTADWSIFPNPGTGVFNLQYAGENAMGTIEILDLTGRVVYAEQAQLNTSAVRTIDLSGVAAGNYAVRLTRNGARTEQRLLVK